MTGREPPDVDDGLQTLPVRQPSPWVPRMRPEGPANSSVISSATGPPPTSSGWGQTFPTTVASRSPVHGSGGTGGRKRRSSPVGAPYGTPRNTSTPSASAPLTAPAAVFTAGWLMAASVRFCAASTDLGLLSPSELAFVYRDTAEMERRKGGRPRPRRICVPLPDI